MKKLILVTLLSLGLPGCAASKYPADSGFNKQNFSHDQYAKDAYVCATAAKNVRAPAVNMLANTGAAGAFISGFAEGQGKREAQMDAHVACMANKGYAVEVMPEEERASRIQASKDYYKNVIAPAKEKQEE